MREAKKCEMGTCHQMLQEMLQRGLPFSCAIIGEHTCHSSIRPIIKFTFDGLFACYARYNTHCWAMTVIPGDIPWEYVLHVPTTDVAGDNKTCGMFEGFVRNNVPIHPSAGKTLEGFSGHVDQTEHFVEMLAGLVDATRMRQTNDCDSQTGGSKIT